MGFDLAQETDPGLLGRLQKITGYDLVVVDTPPALGSRVLATVVAIADYLILPTPPAPMDLAVLIETVKKAVIPAGVAHRVLLTRVDQRCLGEAREAQKTLMELGKFDWLEHCTKLYLGKGFRERKQLQRRVRPYPARMSTLRIQE